MKTAYRKQIVIFVRQIFQSRAQYLYVLHSLGIQNITLSVMICQPKKMIKFFLPLCIIIPHLMAILKLTAEHWQFAIIL